MKQTVRSIAEQAQVSPATVSRVLNGTGSVSGEIRKKVLALLDSFGAAAPKRRQSAQGGNIGVLLLPGSEFDPRVILSKLSVVIARLPRRWNLILLSPESLPLELETKHLRGELAGLLLFGHAADAGFDEALARIPHVWLNSYRAHGASSVLMGNEFAGRIAVRHLLAKHCKKLLCLELPSRNPGFSARCDGFRFECFSVRANGSILKLKLPRGETLETCSGALLDAAFERGSVLSALKKIDGIFSPEDRLTAFLYRALSKAHAKTFPRVVSCNYTPEYLAGLYPRPASVSLGAKTAAELGLEELFRRIEGRTERADDVAVIASPELIEGDF